MELELDNHSLFHLSSVTGIGFVHILQIIRGERTPTQEQKQILNQALKEERKRQFDYKVQRENKGR